MNDEKSSSPRYGTLKGLSKGSPKSLTKKGESYLPVSLHKLSTNTSGILSSRKRYLYSNTSKHTRRAIAPPKKRGVGDLSLETYHLNNSSGLHGQTNLTTGGQLVELDHAIERIREKYTGEGNMTTGMTTFRKPTQRSTRNLKESGIIITTSKQNTSNGGAGSNTVNTEPGKREDDKKERVDSVEKRRQIITREFMSSSKSLSRGAYGGKLAQTQNSKSSHRSIKTKQASSSKSSFIKKFVFDETHGNSSGNVNSNGNGHSNENGLSPTKPELMHSESAGIPSLKRDEANSDSNFPMTAAKAIRLHQKCLTSYEQGEILDYQQIYFLGQKADKFNPAPNQGQNFGFDDERGDYNILKGDHISYRYEIFQILGKGSFGQVCKCYDHKEKKYLALKIIRNKKRFHYQAAIEVKILDHIRTQDNDGVYPLVQMQNYFVFRKHLCITFDLLSINLYEFIKNNDFKGISPGLIRRFAVQILQGLKFLRREKIIHCDLKPENILLTHPHKSAIQIIDFGSSCFEEEKVYTYIQSRFYRAPEIILGIPYKTQIDMWSFGCILAELYTGYPVFPGESEQEQLLCIMEIKGTPPAEILEMSTRKNTFFDEFDNPKIITSSRGRKRLPGTKTFAHRMKCYDDNFINFLEGCLEWDMTKRMTPETALQHPWITDKGLTNGHASARVETSTSSGSRTNFLDKTSMLKTFNKSGSFGSAQNSSRGSLFPKKKKKKSIGFAKGLQMFDIEAHKMLDPLNKDQKDHNFPSLTFDNSNVAKVLQQGSPKKKTDESATTRAL